jgi:hypothetical protein
LVPKFLLAAMEKLPVYKKKCILKKTRTRNGNVIIPPPLYIFV